MWIILLLFTNFVWSDEDFSSEKYCFSGSSEATLAHQKFSAIEVNSDKASRDGECLVVQMRPHRRELIQRFFQSSFPDMRVAFSSQERRRTPCRLKVEKHKVFHSQSTELGVNKFLNAAAEKSERTQVEEIEIETLGDFELSYNQDQIKGLCKFIHSKLYEITLEVRKDPLPIVPTNLPPGAIVVVNEAPKDQETSFLKTQVQLSHGEKIEIGNVIQKLKYQDNKLDINSDLKFETSNKKTNEKVYLSLH